MACSSVKRDIIQETLLLCFDFWSDFYCWVAKIKTFQWLNILGAVAFVWVGILAGARPKLGCSTKKGIKQVKFRIAFSLLLFRLLWIVLLCSATCLWVSVCRSPGLNFSTNRPIFTNTFVCTCGIIGLSSAIFHNLLLSVTTAWWTPQLVLSQRL